jgi:LysR family transcriptional regulator, transcriptional activator for dmlA
MPVKTLPAPIEPNELPFFVALAGSASLSACARELGITTAAVSRRLTRMENRLGMTLVTRTTRRMSLTSEGQTLLDHARRIIADIERLDETLASARSTAQGLLRVNATLGFGRMHIAPLVGLFVERFPAVEVQLQLSAEPPPPSNDSYDVCIRFGNPPDSRLIARKLANNRRILCASPAYIGANATPRTAEDLQRHTCIDIRQGSDPYGQWRLGHIKAKGRRTWQTVRIRTPLVTNDGEVAVAWALSGRGIVMRAEWDVERYVASGRLKHIMPNYVTPNADIHAVWPQRHQRTVRVRAFVDFLANAFRDGRPATGRLD